MKMEIKPIAYIKSDFDSKFGIPRQSGLVSDLKAEIHFSPEYRVADAFRGLEEFSHIWLIWEFSDSKKETWSPTVRPPKLGGNERKGVFATRSPFRPNHIGLSCVELERIDFDTKDGPVLHVLGADLLNKTPIYDIKPYIPMTDCKSNAAGSFSDKHKNDNLKVIFAPELKNKIPKDKQSSLIGILAGDPRPSYHNSPKRIYGLTFGGQEIKFTVNNNTLNVVNVK